MDTKEISIKLIKLTAENPVDIRDAKLILYDKYLKYFLDYDSQTLVDKEDPILGWKDAVKNYYDIYVKKSSVTAIEKFWNQHEKKWQIDIIVGGADDLKILFRRVEEGAAEELLQILLDWWLE